HRRRRDAGIAGRGDGAGAGRCGGQLRGRGRRALGRGGRPVAARRHVSGGAAAPEQCRRERWSGGDQYRAATRAPQSTPQLRRAVASVLWKSVAAVCAEVTPGATKTLPKPNFTSLRLKSAKRYSVAMLQLSQIAHSNPAPMVQPALVLLLVPTKPETNKLLVAS